MVVQMVGGQMVYQVALMVDYWAVVQMVDLMVD